MPTLFVLIKFLILYYNEKITWYYVWKEDRCTPYLSQFLVIL